MTTRHGKTPIRLMSRFFTRERFAGPQVIAGLLLLTFLLQCICLVRYKLQTTKMDNDEMFVLEAGLRRWHGQPPVSQAMITAAHASAMNSEAQEGNVERSNEVFDPNHSALYYLVAAAPLLIYPGGLQPEFAGFWGWLVHAPSLFFGVMLGASLWYVARRLYGNAGGYFALVLYCFAPGLIRSTASWHARPEMGAAWGAFGSIFTAIAVAHTLYAPREVVLWNWRRIVLLGISLALAIGSQFSLIVLAPVVLGFLLYLAPERRLAGIVIWGAACAIGLLLLLSSYGFHPGAFWEAMRHARFFGYGASAFSMWTTYRNLFGEVGQICSALIIVVPAALVTYAGWRRARYFGNTAPLLITVVFVGIALATVHYPGLGFRLIAVPFLFLFAAGITADLLETRYRSLVQACACGLLAAYALWSLMELARAVRT
jgi:hypothetical protein